MTSRSFALSSLVAAIPGAALAVLIVMAILSHSGEIFASIPLAASLIVALICGVVVAIAPLVIFFRGRSESKTAGMAPVPRPGEAADESGELFTDDSSGELIAGGSSGELDVADSSGEFDAGEFDAGGASDEVLVDDGSFVGGDSGEVDVFEADEGSDSFEEDADDDPFADFDDDADDRDGDSFFDQPSKK